MKHTDLKSLANDAAALPRSTTILQESGLRVLLLHLKPGERLPEHQARNAITVQCLSGEVRFASGEETVELKPGLLISLPPGAAHGLEAQNDALLLVTLATSDAHP